MAQAHFTPTLFRFLRDLKRHNDRHWFVAHKAAYERDVRDPLLRFIAEIAEPLARVSPAVLVDPRPIGGSMFRIYRDTRFAKDKTPYKTHAAAHFRHRAGRNVHAPGFYLHLEPANVFFGAGIWHPDKEALARIRAGILENAGLWRKITTARTFVTACTWDGDVAKRVPSGVPPDHPLLADLKRKDFTVLADVAEGDALRPDFAQRFLRFCRAASGLNEFLARSLGLPW
jgi:uncharacterized protein (TIGR02453 family)